ncbi:MAG: SNARE associated Golgi protein [Candidatus Dependentiae bacterium ADurb.Bin331]|nr:MAG: SNARE associated Golgi protein [Candidatus Dependentiae bacterium ADurb.Bin331]
MNVLRRWYAWFGAQVHEPYAIALLAILFFVEAIIFIPVDPLLVIYCVEYPSRSYYFALVATLASVAGGLIGYLIGAFCWDLIGLRIATFFFSPEQFESTAQLCKNYQGYALLCSAVVPVPFKLLTLSCGFFRFPITQFIIFALIARGIRFFLVAAVLRTYGSRVKEYIDRYFNQLVLLLIGVLILLFVFIKK